MAGPSPTFWVILPFILAVAWILPEKLERRDAKVNIDWPRVPIPSHGKVVTLQHSPEDIERFVYKESNQDKSSLLIAPQVDLYYEALYNDNDDKEGGGEGSSSSSSACTKAFVILPGTNSQTWIYNELIDRMRSLGFCTLVFDWRWHGRSESTPGDITTELFMLDAAAIIDKVFPNQQVHIWGWSLGGFVGYQLAIYKPQLVKSLFVFGSTSCFAPIPETSTECVDQWNFPKVFFSRPPIMRLLGLELEAMAVATVIKLKQPFITNDARQRFFHSLRMEQKTKTPHVWLQIQGAKTFQQLDRIVCPFQQMAAEHEITTTGASLHSMKLEAAKIAKAEPPILMQDPAGEGFSHFAFLEEGGMDIMFSHLKAFYEKHA